MPIRMPHRIRKLDVKVPLGVKVLLVRLHRKLQSGRSFVNALFDDDPWKLLGLFGLRNWDPIHHEKNTSHPIVDGSVYIIGWVKSGKAQERKIFEGDPLGPEDYELGLKVGQSVVETLTSEEQEVLTSLWRKYPDREVSFSSYFQETSLPHLTKTSEELTEERQAGLRRVLGLLSAEGAKKMYNRIPDVAPNKQIREILRERFEEKKP